MAYLIETGAERYRPDPAYAYAGGGPMRVDQRKLASFVGLIALGLPCAMLLGTAFGTCVYNTISHFYYAQFWGDVLVGAVIFIGAFLLAYRGQNPAESRLASLAGLAALAGAVFPTRGRGCEAEAFSGRALADFERLNGAELASVVPQSATNSFFELSAASYTIHLAAGLVFFAFLAYQTFFVFTRVTDSQRGPDRAPAPPKRKRNRLYYLSGAVIVASLLAIALNKLLGFEGWDEHNLSFWCETLALWFFGLSWLVKGRFFGRALLDEGERLHENARAA